MCGVGAAALASEPGGGAAQRDPHAALEHAAHEHARAHVLHAEQAARAVRVARAGRVGARGARVEPRVARGHAGRGTPLLETGHGQLWL